MLDALEMPFAGSDPLARVRVVLPQEQSLDALFAAAPFRPFAPETLAFVERLGRSLLTDPKARRFPELVALGFWARAANLQTMRARFDAAYPQAARLPRGIALHIAPSNVDTIFVYSLLLSVLAGNVNLVRISSRAGEQSNLLLDLLGRALEDAPPTVRQAIGVIRYDHDKAITDALSQACDVRVVWGGDATVNLIRQSPLAVHGTELVFPNRYSLSVVGAQAWLDCDRQAEVARSFVNDSLWFGQAACSSPRGVVWIGSPHETHAASLSFWGAVEQAAEVANFPWEDAQAVAKLLAEQDAAVVDGATIVPLDTNYVRVARCDLRHLGEANAAGGGFFREFAVSALAELAQYSRKNWQTISSFGVPRETWEAFLQDRRIVGIDRIVPFGAALNFSAIWDGVDIIAAMTRIVSLDI